MLSKTSEIRDRMIDEVSKKMFDLRVKYSIDHDRDELVKEHFKLFDKGWYVHELDEIMELNSNPNEICIFGAGKLGKETELLLRHTKYSECHIFFADNDRKLVEKGTVNNRKVIGPEQLRGFQGIVIIENATSVAQMYDQLRCLVKRKQILIPDMRHMVAYRGIQYFDEFVASDDEVFMDVGCYDGENTFDFVNWCKNRYEHIYAFEANAYDAKICKRKIDLKNVKKVTLIEKGVWSKKGEIGFSGNGMIMGYVDSNATEFIKVDTIDNVLHGERVTFIKMDIEGSELEALRGAEESIRKYKPRLAISIYHKPEDIWTLLLELLKFNPEYQFLIRPYWSTDCETVLYAF